MLATDLERQIRRGGLGLLRVFRRNSITIRGFLRLYSERFTIRSGYVTVKDSVQPGTPAPSTPDPPAPPAEVPLAEQIRMADERAAARKAARKQSAKERLRGMSVAYGSRAPESVS